MKHYSIIFKIMLDELLFCDGYIYNLGFCTNKDDDDNNNNYIIIMVIIISSNECISVGSVFLVCHYVMYNCLLADARRRGFLCVCETDARLQVERAL